MDSPGNQHGTGARTDPADPGGCRRNNLTNKNFYINIISTFVNVKLTKTQVEKNAYTVIN